MAIRILLVLPLSMQEELQQTIAASLDCVVVGAVGAPLDTLLAVRNQRADVVVVGADGTGELPGVVTHLFAEYPEVKVLCVASGGATLCYLGPIRKPIADISPAGLVNSIREVSYE